MTQIDLQQAIQCFPALGELAASGEEAKPFAELIPAQIVEDEPE